MKVYCTRTKKWVPNVNGNYVDGKFYWGEQSRKWVAKTYYDTELQTERFETKDSAIEWLTSNADFIVTPFQTTAS